MFNIVLIIQYISIVLLAVESIYTFYKWKTKNQSFLFVYCFAAMINNAAYASEMVSGSFEESYVAVRMCYIGKVWIPIAFFMLIMELCEYQLPKKLVATLYTIHSIVFFLVFFSDRHTLYYTADRSWVETGFFPHIKFGHSPIYWGYFVLVILYIIVGTIVLIHKHRVNKNEYDRRIYRFLLAAVGAMSASYVIYMTGLSRGFDSTSLGYAVSSVILFVAIFKYHIMDKLSMVRDYAIDIISEGVLAIDYNGKKIFGNTPFEKVLKQSGKTIEEAIDIIVERADAGKTLIVGDRIYEPVMSPLMRGEDSIGKLFVISDVTAKQKHLEELEEQKNIAEAANASKSAFLSVVSHEIRTPMNAIVGMTELLLKEKDALNEKQAKYLNNIKNSGAALVMIVNDILDQSKIEAGKMEIIDAPYELRPMIDDVKMIIENRIGSKPIELICDIDEAVPQYLEGDSLRIRQIIINLMNNAVKFTEDGFIKLGISVDESEPDRNKIRFSVKDSGQGIKPEDLAKLGEAFVQVDTKKNHAVEGTGLGLSISRDFISLMGGQLEVASEYGKGTEFFFSVWQGVSNGVDEDEENGLNKQAWDLSQNFKAPGVKALVVDDTEINLMVAKEFLKTLDIQVDTAKSGNDAIELVKNSEYDIIFMDYMMPYMDGIETTSIIRELPNWREVPIIALSGDDSSDTRERFQNAGINDYMVKPIEITQIKKIVLKWIDSKRIVSE